MRVAVNDGERVWDAVRELLLVKEAVKLPVRVLVKLALSVGDVEAVTLRDTGDSVAVTELVCVGVLDTVMQAEDADTER